MSAYLTTIEAALRKGGVLHAFLSGGGLRVVRIEEGRHGPLMAYGEHPHIDDALAHTAEDYLAGHRPYGEVYGGSKPHYLTGSTTPSGPLDLWVRKGHTFDARAEGDEVVVELKGLERQEHPQELLERAWHKGETSRYEARGYVFEIAPSRFPNGETAACITTISRPEGRPHHRDTLYRVVKTGRAATLAEAIEMALGAESVEVLDER